VHGLAHRLRPAAESGFFPKPDGFVRGTGIDRTLLVKRFSARPVQKNRFSLKKTGQGLSEACTRQMENRSPSPRRISWTNSRGVGYFSFHSPSHRSCVSSRSRPRVRSYP